MSKSHRFSDIWHGDFIKRCNRLELDKKQDTIVFFLNRNEVIGHFHCREIENANLALLMAKKQNADAVFVGRNVVEANELAFHDQTKEAIIFFRTQSEQVGIPFVDFLLVTKNKAISASACDLL